MTPNCVSHLPKDLIDMITKRLNLDDLIRFSSVCRSWNFIASSLIPNPRRNNPWLIVPLRDHKKTNCLWEKTLGFFSLSNGKTYEVEVLKMDSRRICGIASSGWIVTIHEKGEIQLLHPFLKAVVDLPPITKLPWHKGSHVNKEKKLVYSISKPLDRELESDFIRETCIEKVIMSSSESPATATVMAIQGYLKNLIFCKVGNDKKWNLVEGDDNNRFDDVTFYQGNFYAVQAGGHVFVVERLNILSPAVKLVMNPPYDKMDPQKYYLAGCLGQLLLVIRFLYDHGRFQAGFERNSYRTTRFEVFKLDFDAHKWVKVNNLGEDHALFLGTNQAFTLRTSDVPGCKENCIYFSDDHLDYVFYNEPTGGYDIGVFDLRYGTTAKCYPCDASFIKPSPVWFTTASC
ncbi:hypothetical protein ACHQM5_010484 [Ranunculus cassubicifolius]